MILKLQDILKSDADKTSWYVVGGNIFWETHLFSPNITSFTTSGFFAQKGYVEPRISKTKQVVYEGLIITGVIIVLIAILAIYCIRK